MVLNFDESKELLRLLSKCSKAQLNSLVESMIKKHAP